MASEYYGLNRGADESAEAVTAATSTQSTDVEVRVDLTKNLTRLDVTQILKAIIRRLENSGSVELGNI